MRRWASPSSRPTGKIVEANGAFAEFFGSAPRPAQFRRARVGRSEKDASARSAIARAAIGRNRTRAGGNPRRRRRPPHRRQLFASPFMRRARRRRRARSSISSIPRAQKALEAQFAQSQKMQAIGQLGRRRRARFQQSPHAIIGNCDLLLMRHPAGDPSFAGSTRCARIRVSRRRCWCASCSPSRASRCCSPKCWRLPISLPELSNWLRRAGRRARQPRIRARPGFVAGARRRERKSPGASSISSSTRATPCRPKAAP